MSGAGDRIKAELVTWPGVTAEPHRFGGVEYRYGRKEMGHVHGDRLADRPFPTPHRGGRAPPSRTMSCPKPAGSVVGFPRPMRRRRLSPSSGSTTTATRANPVGSPLREKKST